MKGLPINFSILLILAFVSVSHLHAQEIPNPGFENWTGNTPDGWLANNPPGFQAVSSSSDAHTGSLSARLEVVDFGFPLGGAISSGTDGLGFAVSQRYEALNGYFKFSPQSGDFFDIFVQMWIGGVQGTQIGDGRLSVQTAVADWTQFSAPIDYSQSGTPDLCTVQIQVAAQSNFGGVAHVDDLEFGAATDVEQIEGNPVSYSLMQNYPNPFNPSTLIEYSIPEESFVELNVYDILGNEIATLVNEQQPAGNYRADFNANTKPAGLYFARLTSNEFTKVIKMTLLK